MTRAPGRPAASPHAAATAHPVSAPSIAGTCELPSALTAVDSLLADAPRLLVCLDFDGTLAPIVARPELAALAPSTRNVVRELAGLCPTAIVSGRDRRDVAERVDVAEAYYVGSHGFDVSGPPGSSIALALGEPYLPALDGAESALRARTAGIPGAIVERKRFSVATHYRLVERALVPVIDSLVSEILEAFPDLRREPGKEVIEVQPNVAWDKGKAVLWLTEALGLEDALPIHVGDDLTDETVFAVLAEHGVGIFVGENDRTTAARFRLRNPAEVELLLRRIVVLLRARTTGPAGPGAVARAGRARLSSPSVSTRSSLPQPARYFPVKATPLRMEAGLLRHGTDLGNGPADRLFFQVDEQLQRYLAAPGSRRPNATRGCRSSSRGIARRSCIPAGRRSSSRAGRTASRGSSWGATRSGCASGWGEPSSPSVSSTANRGCAPWACESPQGPRSSCASLAECLGEVGDQVVGVLEPDGQADQVRRDLVGGAHDARVRHGPGQLDQRLDPAERLGQDEEPGALGHPVGFLGRRDLERDHAAEPAHLPRGDVVAGMRRQAREEDGLRHLRMVVQEGRHGGRALAVGAHAHGQRLQAPQRQVAIHRTGDGARPIRQESQRLDPFRVARDDGAADQVGVTAEVLREAVDHGVGPEFQRALERRRREGVVDHGPGSGARGRPR